MVPGSRQRAVADGGAADRGCGLGVVEGAGEPAAGRGAVSAHVDATAPPARLGEAGGGAQRQVCEVARGSLRRIYPSVSFEDGWIQTDELGIDMQLVLIEYGPVSGPRYCLCAGVTEFAISRPAAALQSTDRRHPQRLRSRRCALAPVLAIQSQGNYLVRRSNE